MHAQAAMQLPPGGGSGNSIGSGAENTVVPMQVELGGRLAKGGGLPSSACGGARAHPHSTSIGLGGTPVRLTSSQPGVAEHGVAGDSTVTYLASHESWPLATSSHIGM
jgi:hypothetical protein